MKSPGASRERVTRGRAPFLSPRFARPRQQGQSSRTGIFFLRARWSRVIRFSEAEKSFEFPLVFTADHSPSFHKNRGRRDRERPANPGVVPPGITFIPPPGRARARVGCAYTSPDPSKEERHFCRVRWMARSLPTHFSTPSAIIPSSLIFPVVQRMPRVTRLR